MDSTKIKAIIVAVLATFAALYLGNTAATAQLETAIWVIGTIGFATCLLLGNRIWLLLPFASTLSLTFRLPGLPSTTLIAQILILAFCSLLFFIRKLPYRFRITELEIWAIILVFFVAQTYIRNPVGFRVFGTEMVGGKPYALFIINLATCALLAGLSVPTSDLRWVIRLSVIGGIINFAANLVGHFIPAIGFYYGAVYGVDESGSQDPAPDPDQATRINFLGKAGKLCSLVLSSYISPLRTLIRPLWFLFLLGTLALSAMSGYRNEIATVSLILFFGLIYRGGFIQVIISSLLGIFALVLLAIVNSATPLPANAQRALSFLPGTWEESIRRDAKNSTDWRYEIWEEVLFTDRWIDNKFLGDGLGFSSRELEAQLAAKENKMRGISGFDAHRETILANGDYHSGPVQTIRTIGYLGLFFLLIIMVRLATHAHRVIKQHKNTDWFPLTLFIGIPLLVQPIFFVFVFGTFASAAATTLIGIGMIRLLQNNLNSGQLINAGLQTTNSQQGRARFRQPPPHLAGSS